MVKDTDIFLYFGGNDASDGTILPSSGGLEQKRRMTLGRGF